MRRGQVHDRPQKGKQGPAKSDSSRLSPLVMNNPVNQAADWSHESYFLQDIVSMFHLPQVVRCASRLMPGEDKFLPFNIYVPMLLCSGRTAKKLLAKHVGRDARTQHLMETEDSIVIPSDYDGHFLSLQARTTKDRTAVCSLLQIANNPIPAFINLAPVKSFACTDTVINKGSTDNINSDISETSGSHVSGHVNKSSNKHRVHIVPQKCLVHPAGSVFVVSGTAKGTAKVKSRTREVTLLRCSNEEGKDLFIPCDQAGDFLQVEVPSNGSMRLSVLPEDLVSTNRYPQLVRYVYGDHPPRLTPCSKTFTLIDSFEEESLIGCLLYPNHALMIEVPMTSTLNFQVANNHDEVMSMSLPQHALSVVRTREETFIRDLKLKCKFVHLVSSGFGQPVGRAAGTDDDDDMPSATMRARQYANEAFFYM
ncbi:unnamed protein product [Candidula unifasciata]|uniref:CABIT domain-containing protein n=1 Tax=Candidula unifasciata TaxID=100452 RepID=A0A8S3YWP5_9EUPU|nr:unnamed protein product [Candidula unifasciata]